MLTLTGHICGVFLSENIVRVTQVNVFAFRLRRKPQKGVPHYKTVHRLILLEAIVNLCNESAQTY